MLFTVYLGLAFLLLASFFAMPVLYFGWQEARLAVKENRDVIPASRIVCWFAYIADAFLVATIIAYATLLIQGAWWLLWKAIESL